MKQQRLEIIALDDIPSVEPGDNICALIMQSLHSSSIELQDNDVLVVAQKVISKAENRYTYLNSITPDKNASKIADEVNKDPRLVQAILDESNEILRQRPGVIIVEHKLGYIHANAGIDQSNIESNLHNPRVLLLPEDSDLSAKRIREQFKTQIGVDIAVIINDSAGRAWRNGSIGFAIGTAGFAPLINLVGSPDLYGNELKVTEVAVADELAAAASFLMGQADEGQPVALIRGARLQASNLGSNGLIRDRQLDMFR